MLEPIRTQNLGSLLMKLSQSNFNLRSPDCYFVLRYLIATVPKNLGVGVDFRPYREGDFLTRRPYSVGPRISVCPPRGSELKKARTLLHKSF